MHIFASLLLCAVALYFALGLSVEPDLVGIVAIMALIGIAAAFGFRYFASASGDGA